MNKVTLGGSLVLCLGFHGLREISVGIFLKQGPPRALVCKGNFRASRVDKQVGQGPEMIGLSTPEFRS